MSHNGTSRTQKPAQIKAGDVYLMAVKLLARHGSAACDVAAFSEKEHALRGDTMREAAWKAVHSTLADMLANRLPLDGVRIH
jgi:hypothetical protein